ncbi:MAG TPA: CheW domain-containing protein [Terracidiphilus sp.]|nr:CheW domain-containing protein [Terracidiphilus sp.]
MSKGLEGESGKLVQVCSVRVGEELYGILLGRILEIVGGARPQTEPLAPDFIGGLVHYRGDVLTTVNLRRVLGMAPAGTTQDLLVLEDAEGPFGLIVDSVREVLTVSSADFEPKPSTVRKRKALFAGAFKLRDGLMVMLETTQLQPMRLALMREGVEEPVCAR